MKKAILVVSFGTSYADTEKKTICAIEEDVRAAFPDCEIRRAYTSGMIMKKIRERDGIIIDNVEQALNRLKEDGFEEVFLQPTHIINGDEYEKITSAAAEYEDSFTSINVGRALLSSSSDYELVCSGIMKQFPELKKDEMLLLMGHGTGHFADAAYAAIDYRFKEMGYGNVYVATVEGYPELEQVMPAINAYNPKRIILMPFMVVAGDHAINDMAGDEEDSWKEVLGAEGYNVECVVRGMGEIKDIRDIYIKHILDGEKR